MTYIFNVPYKCLYKPYICLIYNNIYIAYIYKHSDIEIYKFVHESIITRHNIINKWIIT